MFFDLHSHTNRSRCAHADATMQAVVKAASERGLDGLGITDHLHPHIDPAIFTENRRLLSLVEKQDVQVWIGVEVDVVTLSGEITGNPDIYNSLDYVMAGIHHYHLDWVEGPDITKTADDVVYFAHQNLIHTVRNPWVNAVGHPWVGMHNYLRGFKFSYDLVKPEWIEELGFEALRHQTAIELPAYALIGEDGSTDEAYMNAIVRPLIKTGCLLMTGTDSHRPEGIGLGIEPSVRLLLQNGASEQQLWSPERLSRA